jgi:hypothetical protein
MIKEMPSPSEFARLLVSSFLNGDVTTENLLIAREKATQVANNELEEFPLETIKFWMDVKDEIAKQKQS